MGSITQPTVSHIKHNNSETTTVVELDMDPYQLTTYSVGILYYESTHRLKQEREYRSWLRGVNEITNVQRTDVKNIYTIRYLVTQLEYIADVTHLKPSITTPTTFHSTKTFETFA